MLKLITAQFRALILTATVLTNAGVAICANRLHGAGTEPVYIDWGTGAGTAAVADTGVFTAGGEARVAGTASIVTTTVTNDTWQVIGTLTASTGKTITNAGNFDASTAGNIHIHGDFTGVVLASGDSIQFTFKQKFVAG